MNKKVNGTAVFLFIMLLSVNYIRAQYVEATSINLNSRSQYGGDYPTDNSNYQNVLSIGGIGAETGLKIYKQDAGAQASFAGSQNYQDAYVFEMTDSNDNTVDGSVVYGATGKDDVFKHLFVIQGNGNVGIGMKFPTAKLSVNGKINAKEVQVTATGWPDYVFEPNYSLLSLHELETFINENQHLPEIPSAKEVGEKGISLAEMDAKLLKKIEELSLYVIELNRTIESQNNRIKELEIRK
ncbi:hypothetical protein [Labilibaculum euxinus]